MELPAISSIATSLGARKVCQRALELLQRHSIHSLVVSDLQAVQACLRLFEDFCTAVEPACGASLAAVHDHSRFFADYLGVLVVVCGGTGVTLEHLEQWRRELGSKSADVMSNETITAHFDANR